MKRFAHLRLLFAVVGLIYLVFPQAAYAYLDPGTGSYLVQILVVALAGLAFAIKLGWSRIRALFDRIFSKTSSEEQKDDE